MARIVTSSILLFAVFGRLDAVAEPQPRDPSPNVAAHPSSSTAGTPDGGSAITHPKTAMDLFHLRAKHDEEVWSNELLAQAHERPFTKLWDGLLFSSDKFAVLRGQEFDRLIVPTGPRGKLLDHGIEVLEFTGPPKTIAADAWSDWLADFQLAEFEIVETEWHHKTFDPPAAGEPARSTVAFVIHATNQPHQQRYIVRGTLKIEWSDRRNNENRPIPSTIDATDVTVLTRKGPPSFREVRSEVFARGPTGTRRVRPSKQLILHDLNRDGLPEVVVGGANKVFRNEGNWQFRVDSLCAHPATIPDAGVFADFNGDGIDDYLCLARDELPRLYVGTPEGSFPGEPRIIRSTAASLPDPAAATAGDVDGDGDTDVFIGQSMLAYDSGEIPTPYYDANDGYPAYLLVNDGRGNFTDVTVEAGLAPKRHRRIFSASLVDLDDDGDLDLLTVSDFSGADLFVNDGQGKFTDASERLQPKAYAFGMSHSFGDYDLDGRLDFILIGMSSTTARRLEYMQLGREEFPEHNAARPHMGYGNRMYLARDGGRFVQAAFNETVARTGWAWGSTTLDFDNDADPDLLVVNGQMSGKTTQDYCTRFWCHDIYYEEGERPDEAIRAFFAEMGPIYAHGLISWNGFEHNALLMNLGGKEFVNVAFLMGAAHEFDSRAAVSGDLDGDGRVDLLVEEQDQDRIRSKVYFLRNEHPSENHWIGLRLESSRPDVSPWGAKIALHLADGRKLLAHNVTGHSVWSQHASIVHFGLGQADEVARIEVRWPNGQSTTIPSPEVDAYHVVNPPTAAR